jgi:hypothetical protein
MNVLIHVARTESMKDITEDKAGGKAHEAKGAPGKKRQYVLRITPTLKLRNR